MVADVVVENASYSFDIPFSYRVPGRMEGQIRPGCRVLVPFGRSNRSKQGLVLHLQPQDPQSQQLKPIKMLLDQKPLLGEEQLWMLELLGYMYAVQAGFLQSSRRGSRARSWLPGSLWSPCHSRWTPESLTASDQSV